MADVASSAENNDAAASKIANLLVRTNLLVGFWARGNIVAIIPVMENAPLTNMRKDFDNIGPQQTRWPR